jgi:hypothetical protein
LKEYKSPGSNQILAELIQAEGETLQTDIHKLINCIWNEELPDQWKKYVVVPVWNHAHALNFALTLKGRRCPGRNEERG